MSQISIAQQLQAPFRQEDYTWRAQSENYNGTELLVLCYVTARAIQTRLDEVFGPFGWSTTYRAGPDGGVICELSCYDKVTKSWVKKEDASPNTDIEPVKGGISKSLVRAAVAWGIGRLLYKLVATKVKLQTTGKHYHKVKKAGPNKDKWMYWDEPPLPPWAVSGPVPPEEKTGKKTTKKTEEPPKAETKPINHKATFTAAFAARCKEQNLDAATLSVPIKNAVFAELLKSPDIFNICLNTGYADTSATMSETHTGWLVLTEIVKNYDIQAAILCGAGGSE